MRESSTSISRQKDVVLYLSITNTFSHFFPYVFLLEKLLIWFIRFKNAFLGRVQPTQPVNSAHGVQERCVLPWTAKSLRTGTCLSSLWNGALLIWGQPTNNLCSSGFSSFSLFRRLLPQQEVCERQVLSDRQTKGWFLVVRVSLFLFRTKN